jgi:5-methylcytosine-specific restriction endonuclease McrA
MLFFCPPTPRIPPRSRRGSSTAARSTTGRIDVTVTPNSCPALVLNADYQPLSYFPLSIWSWQDTVKAVFLDRVNIVSEYENTISSPTFRMRLPSVVSLKRYVAPAHRPAFTRFNVFLRDSFTCQYCGTPDDLTFDHLVPRAQGGRTRWNNVITACAPCNLAKGGRTPAQSGMFPAVLPAEPTVHQLQRNGRRFPPNYLHDSWRDYLYWDAELEP